MIEIKRIELKYYPGPIFHHLNEIEEVISAGGDGYCYILCAEHHNKKQVADIIFNQLKEYDLNW